MKIPGVLSVILLAALTLACRQPDGPMPTPDDENANRIGDLGRDLQAIARGDERRQTGFADDLAVFADEHVPESVEAVRGFAVGWARLSHREAHRPIRRADRADELEIGRLTELSDRQLKTLQGRAAGAAHCRRRGPGSAPTTWLPRCLPCSAP